MYWTEFKKTGILALSILLLISCTENAGTEQEHTEKEEKQEVSITKEQRIARMVENELNIPATEEYDIQILYRHINTDTLEDALILVNRKDHAFQHVKSNNNERFFEKTGYTGLFNYVFVLLGDSKRLLTTTPVGSNVNYTLRAEFLELTSRAHTDFFVEYRINNSLQRNYYTVRGNEVFLTFSCPVFDKVGDPIPVVYDIQHKESSVRLTKDIALYHATFLDYNLKEIEDVNAYEPKEIQSSDDLYVYFIFDDNTMKYVTPMAPPVSEE
ncbi:MAG TPA: hypothetical protein VKX31_05470 [Brumimicrobium sp.]|nr:hypothetical protein [Brumimicrobium sp.]